MERFCLHCGSKISEGEKFCANCGASTEDARVVNNGQVAQSEGNVINNETQNSTNNTQSTSIENKTGTNPLAIASFVCSLVGLLVAGIWMGIIAISFSVAAKRQLKVYKNQKGNGFATAGLVIGIVDIAFVILGIILNIALL